MTEQTVPQRVIGGRYVVLDRLGQGGMGIVWRAQDRVIGRQVAIKELVLPADVAPTERRVYSERVLREARTAGKLTAPGVVTVHDVVTEHGHDFIVMELVEAPTLDDVVRRGGPLPETQVSAIATQTLAALDAAHAAGVVHRDVKPSNIMLLPDGRVKLADFGIAQTTDDPRLTGTGSVIGSPGYMAPERLQHNIVDPAGDLWSLGGTLFFAVEGHGPFDRDTSAATLFAVMSEVPTLQRCRGPLAAVIMGLLVGDPEARLRTPQVRALLDRTPPGPPAPTRLDNGGAAPTRAVAQAPVTLGSLPLWRRVGLGALAAVAAVILVALTWGITSLASPDPAGGEYSVHTYGPGGDVQFGNNSLSAGYCAVGQLSPGWSLTIDASCSEPHDMQAFGTIDVFGSSDTPAYPGVDELGSTVRAYCALVFGTERVTGDDKDSVLAVSVLVPSERVWQGDGDTTGSSTSYCVLSRSDGTQLTGSRLPGDT